MSSDIFANLISFFSLIIAIIALLIGGFKVHKLLADFKTKKRNAVFGYYMNLKIFINRLIRLTINNQNEALGHIYLLSSNEELRDKYKNCKDLSQKLSTLSEKFLDYLSSTSNQIPIADDEKEDENWNNLIDDLVGYLSDFLLFNSKVYLPNLNNVDSVNQYCRELNSLLQKLLCLIEKSKKDFWYELTHDMD